MTSTPSARATAASRQVDRFEEAVPNPDRSRPRHSGPWSAAWSGPYQVRDRERLVIVTRVARRDEGTYRGI
jgi:hypothetical protein